MPATHTEVSVHTYQWTVQGMDCPSCAGKIRGAVERLKGVSDVQVSVMKETLRLGLDTQQTSMERVEKTVERLGYSVQFMPDSDTASPENSSECHSPCCDGNAQDNDAETVTVTDRADAESTLSWKVG